MTARFTPHRYTDGSTRITMNLSYTLTARDIAFLLCSAHRSTDPDDLPELTYTTAVKTIRCELRQRGSEDFYYWADDVDEDDQDEAEALIEWSHSEVARLFPELGAPG